MPSKSKHYYVNISFSSTEAMRSPGSEGTRRPASRHFGQFPMLRFVTPYAGTAGIRFAGLGGYLARENVALEGPLT